MARSKHGTRPDFPLRRVTKISDYHKEGKLYISNRIDQLLAIKQVINNDLTKIKFNVLNKGHNLSESITVNNLQQLDKLIDERLLFLGDVSDGLAVPNAVKLNEETYTELKNADIAEIQPIFSMVKVYLEKPVEEFNDTFVEFSKVIKLAEKEEDNAGE